MTSLNAKGTFLTITNRSGVNAPAVASLKTASGGVADKPCDELAPQYCVATAMCLGPSISLKLRMRLPTTTPTITASVLATTTSTMQSLIMLKPNISRMKFKTYRTIFKVHWMMFKVFWMMFKVHRMMHKVHRMMFKVFRMMRCIHTILPASGFLATVLNYHMFRRGRLVTASQLLSLVLDTNNFLRTSSDH